MEFIFSCLWFVIILAGMVVHFAFAIAVFQNADEVERQRGSTVLVAPWVWTLATLLTGIVGGSLYWLVHHGPDFSVETESFHVGETPTDAYAEDPVDPPFGAPTGKTAISLNTGQEADPHPLRD